MSEDLLESVRLNKPYLQSPIDDLWSVFWVAQWAAVFNAPKGLTEQPGSPELLLDLQKVLLKGDHMQRAFCARRLKRVKKSTEYGEFLVKCAPVLTEWHEQMELLTEEWDKVVTAQPASSDLPSLFIQYCDQGVVHLITLVHEHFPGALGKVCLPSKSR